MSRIDEQKQLNQEHFDSPRPGDFWQEMFCPYFIVVGIEDDLFWICDERKSVDEVYWTWDVSKSRLVKKSYFNCVKYSASSQGFIADVIVRGYSCPFVAEFKKLGLKVPNIKEEKQKKQIETLTKQRDYYLNKYIELLIQQLEETFPGTDYRYIDIIKQENPNLLEKLQKLL
jgi:hypothetical protein